MSKTPILRVPLSAEHDVVLARQRVRQIASRLSVPPEAQTRLATAVSELASRAFRHGDGAWVEVLLRSGDDAVLWVRIHDSGPAIPDLRRNPDGRAPSKIGLGLLGAERLVELFSVHSAPGSTLVELGQSVPGHVDESTVHRLVDALAREPAGDPFAEVLQQNQELLETQQALAQANQDLEEADRAKDHFLAMLGHELRNLLNALRSSIDVWRRSPDVVLRERMSALAVGQTDHLRRLIDDLLDASQIQRGQLEIRAVPLDVRSEIGVLIESWREEVSRAGLRLKVELPDKALWILADPTRLMQILGNLLSNACKFTDPGGEIRLVVESRDDGGHARMTVGDSGCGLSKEELTRIFEPFAQAEQAAERMTGGLGLGLAIVAGLVESQGGSIWAESEGHGHGSRFIVELPTVDTPEQPHERAPADGPRPLRILLVDDHRASAESLAELLRLEDHEVQIAYDGRGALELFKSYAPDVVLCDLGLPGMDGYEVARTLRRTGDGLGLLALSGFADPASKTKALDAGFDAHLSKPVNVGALLERLRTQAD